MKVNQSWAGVAVGVEVNVTGGGPTVGRVGVGEAVGAGDSTGVGDSTGGGVVYPTTVRLVETY